MNVRAAAFVVPPVAVFLVLAAHGVEPWRIVGLFLTIAAVIGGAHLCGYRGGVR